MNKIKIYKKTYTINGKTLTESELKLLIAAYRDYKAFKKIENIHY